MTSFYHLFFFSYERYTPLPLPLPLLTGVDQIDLLRRAVSDIVFRENVIGSWGRGIQANVTIGSPKKIHRTTRLGKDQIRSDHNFSPLSASALSSSGFLSRSFSSDPFSYFLSLSLSLLSLSLLTTMFWSCWVSAETSDRENWHWVSFAVATWITAMPTCWKKKRKRDR